MAFCSANIYVKGLANDLGMNEKELSALIAKNRSGGFARIWAVTDRGEFSTVELSTSVKRVDESGKAHYETDMNNKFVTLSGQAHEAIKGVEIPENGLTVRLLATGVKTPYDAEKKVGYTNFHVYALEIYNGNGEAAKPTRKPSTKKPDVAVDDDDDLPFE